MNGTNADSSPVAVQVVSTLHALACTPITWSKVDGIASQQQRVVVAVTPMTFEGSLFPTASLREEVVLEGEVELSPAKRVKVEQGDASDHPPSPEQQAQVRAEVKVEQQHDTPQASSPQGLILIPREAQRPNSSQRLRGLGSSMLHRGRLGSGTLPLNRQVVGKAGEKKSATCPICWMRACKCNAPDAAGACPVCGNFFKGFKGVAQHRAVSVGACRVPTSVQQEAKTVASRRQRQAAQFVQRQNEAAQMAVHRTLVLQEQEQSRKQVFDEWYALLLQWRDDPEGGNGSHCNIVKSYQYKDKMLGRWLCTQRQKLKRSRTKSRNREAPLTAYEEQKLQALINLGQLQCRRNGGAM